MADTKPKHQPQKKTQDDKNLASLKAVLGRKAEPELDKDRVKVIVSVAEIDGHLSQYLESVLCMSPHDQDELLSSDSAPLGSFMLRAKLARRIGLISNDLYGILKILANIRNDCAHKAQEFDVFNDRTTADRIASVYSRVDSSYFTDNGKVSTREKFIRISRLCSTWFIMKKESAKPIKPAGLEPIFP